MKKQLFSLALLLSLGASFGADSYAATAAAFGQEQRQDYRDHDKGKDRKDKDHKKGRGQFGAQDQQRRTDELAKELGLNAKQKAKVEKIFQDQQQQMQALRGRSGTDRSQVMADAKRIRESSDKQLKSALTKKQYAQFEAKRQERQRQMADRRQNGQRTNDRDRDQRDNNRGGNERRNFGSRS